MTAVCNWDPTPSWLPRNTSKVAVITFEKKEITNTLSEKLRWKYARAAPSNASNAATTMIGRYGCSSTGMSGCTNTPMTTPMIRPKTAAIYLSLLAYVTSPVTAASSVSDVLLLTCG